MLGDGEGLNTDPATTSPCLILHQEAKVGAEVGFAEVLAGVLGVAQVAAESNFFDDLDADSMLMAQFCARVRKRDDLPTVSMKDVYRHPSVAALAASGAGAQAPAGAPRADLGAEPTREGTQGGPDERLVRAPELAGRAAESAAGELAPIGVPRYVLCGALQLLVLVGLTVLGAFLASQGYEWVYKTQGLLGAGTRAGLGAGADPVGAQPHWLLFGAGVVSVYLRSALFVIVGFVLLCALPIVAKWVLIGRWTSRQIRIWSLAYLRFWVVKTLIRTSPLRLFVGTPIYVAYLRALGAKIGPGVAIFSQHVPVCTDLLTIGAGAVIRKDVMFNCYRARAAVIETGPVTLGEDALVSEATVVDIDTSLGQRSQLGHASSLHCGQAVPNDATWHGSPAQPTDVDYRKIESKPCGGLRRWCYSATRLVSTLLVWGPLLPTGMDLLVTRFPRLGALLEPAQTALTTRTFWLTGLIASSVLFFGSIFLGLLLLAVLPRMLNLVIQPGKTYPLYGVRYSVYRLVTRMTNVHFFGRLFGDSSLVTGYLRSAGYRLRQVVQTGSNFGSEFKQDCSYLSSVGAGTMIADGLSIVNADFTSTSFRVLPVSIGARNFLGNKVTYPTMGRTGDNCLLATKVMVPIDGPIRENVGLLGSPSFEIPRSVERDVRIGAEVEQLRRRRLPAKNAHNIVTMALFLLVWWIHSAVLLLLGLIAADRYGACGMWAFAAAGVVSLIFHILYWVLVDRCVRGLQALKPDGCSIYDRAFWRHERFWKVCDDRYLLILNGTPLKNVVWRMLGARIGRRVFDDGAFFPERTFVTIGDDCTLNADTHIQCHSQEDGAFKSDRTTIGHGVTLGVGAFVHYGVTIDDGASLAPDTFVMKGEELPAHTRWIGNPAALAITTTTAHPPSSAALPVDSAPVIAALAARPRAVVEWNGHGWSFPDLEHFADPVQGPVTRLHIDRPGTLRLTGSGDNLRIELIPDTRDHPNTATHGLPLPSELLAPSDPHQARSSPTGGAFSRPHAAGLVLIAMLTVAALLTVRDHSVPAQSSTPSPPCVSGTPGCGTDTAADAAEPATDPSVTAPGTAPQDPDTAPQDPDTAPQDPGTAPQDPGTAPPAPSAVPPNRATTSPAAATPGARPPLSAAPRNRSRTIPPRAAPSTTTKQDSKTKQKAKQKTKQKNSSKTT